MPIIGAVVHHSVVYYDAYCRLTGCPIYAVVEGRPFDVIRVYDDYTNLANGVGHGRTFAVAESNSLRYVYGSGMFHVGGYYGGADL